MNVCHVFPLHYTVHQDNIYFRSFLSSNIWQLASDLVRVGKGCWCFIGVCAYVGQTTMLLMLTCMSDAADAVRWCCQCHLHPRHIISRALADIEERKSTNANSKLLWYLLPGAMTLCRHHRALFVFNKVIYETNKHTLCHTKYYNIIIIVN